MGKALEGFQERWFAMARVVWGALFACHGAQKLFGFPGGHHGPLPPLMLVAGLIEFLGGLSVALGLVTRLAAFVASGEMAVAYVMAHFPRGWWPISNGGELAVVYSFLWLFIAMHGPGPWSLDRLLFRRDTAPTQ